MHILFGKKVYSMKKYFHKMMSGYKSLFFKIGTVIFIFGICLLFSFLIVYPLWFLATQHTHIYTAASLVFFLVLLLSFLIKKNIKEYRRNSKHFFHSLIKKLIILGGLALFFVLLFAYQRTFAFLALIVSFILYGFVAFGLSEDRT